MNKSSPLEIDFFCGGRAHRRFVMRTAALFIQNLNIELLACDTELIFKKYLAALHVPN